VTYVNETSHITWSSQRDTNTTIFATGLLKFPATKAGCAQKQHSLWRIVIAGEFGTWRRFSWIAMLSSSVNRFTKRNHTKESQSRSLSNSVFFS
jgi:hypothetical protein